MDEGIVMQVFYDAFMTAFKLAAPMLIISVLVGLVVAVFQAATQIHEQTLTFVPKLLCIALIMLLTGPWMIAQLSDFVERVFEVIATYG